VAVSPLVGGEAVSGPLAHMLNRMAGGTTPAHVSGLYEGLIDALVIDDSDAPAGVDVELVVTSTRMVDPAVERRLAERVLEVACA
jgi:LPPG:FO 2-phospho-L-lactate transferase